MIIAILLILAAVPPDTVALSLDAAIARALSHSPGLLAERAQARAAAQLPGSATRAFLPSVRAELQGLRTTDPVAVFGMKLRQGVFAANDLALGALNGPSAFGGFTTGIQAELPLLAPEGLFGYAAARRAAAAGAAGTERAAGATVLRVTQAYWDTQLAAGRLIALDTALAAARAHERQAEAMRDQGLVTGLDARMARLQAASVEVQRLAAAAAADNARARLAAFLGLPDTSVIRLVDSLSERGDATCADDNPACTIDERGDLRALTAGAGAADLGAKGAWAAQLPQVAAFGAIARHAHDAPWGEGSGDWTVGIGVRWNVFPALAGVAAVRRARADADASRARLEAARIEATVEAGEARRMVASARAGAAVAGGAELEGAEALAQARLRYRTGSAPITELLDVQAAATQAVLTHQSAQRDLLLALALLDFAYGVHDR